MQSFERSLRQASLRASAEVEAALIIPLVILIIAGMVKLGAALYAKVYESSAENCIKAEVLAGGGLIPAESILRGRWYFK